MVCNSQNVSIIILMPFVVPGPVTDLILRARFLSIVATWRVPLETNGVITRYVVTRRIGSFIPISASTVYTNYTISSLTPRTFVDEVTVSAYTSAGQGESLRKNLTTLDPPRKY